MKINKVFFIFLLFFLIIFISACNNIQIQPLNSSSQEVKTTTTSQKKNESATEITEEGNHQEKTTETISENIIYEKPRSVSLKTYPRISINIIEGPVVLEDSSLCYYRINAKVSANPKARIAFSKDDSFGAWGPETAQINLLPGETFNLTVTASNEIGTATTDLQIGWESLEIIRNTTYIASDENNPVFYRINVSLEEQKVRVYYKDTLLKELICSTGAPETPTPKGSFITTDKIFYSWLPQYDVGAYYFVRFFNSYLFHSTPFDEEGRIIKKEFDNLGIPSSHGCVRLGLEDARWFFESLPSGIKVDIQ